VDLTPTVAGTSPGAQTNVDSVSTTGFTFKNGQNVASTFYWIAFGS